MYQRELDRQVDADTWLGTAHAPAAVVSMLAELSGATARDEAVRLPDFGTLSVQLRPARTMRIPTTGAFITRPAARVVSFWPGRVLREATKGAQNAGPGKPEMEGD